MMIIDAEVLYNRALGPLYYRMGFSWDGGEMDVVPGQFVMLKVTDGCDPLLRRPFGIYNVLASSERRGIEILYKVVGKGTGIMAGLKAGTKVGLFGPLGNGFPAVREGEEVLMVAGGMGIVPFYLLSKELSGRGTLLYGGRGRVEAGLVEDIRALGVEVVLATEDGSVGHKGLVTELVEERLTPRTVVYACGPEAMLKEVALIAHKRGVRCLVSLETAMACGMGVCLGCAVRTRQEECKGYGYRLVCSDGPVFNSEDIEWERV